MRNLASKRQFLVSIVLQPWFAYVVTFFIWGLTLASRLMYNGLVYGFDYGLFHPDGSLYTFRALLFAGYTEESAGEKVADWYEDHSFKAKYSGPELYFENNPFLWDQYMTRVLYPLLSTPFVMLFGVPGMLVVPSITYLITLLISTRIAVRLGAPLVGWVSAILITSSTSIARWMFANITDGLLLLFVSFFILLISRPDGLLLSKSRLLILMLLISLSAITRFSALFWVGVAFLFLFHRRFSSALLVFLTTVVSHIPIFLRPFSGHVLPGHNDKSFGEKLLIYPLNLLRVTVFELGQLFVLDRVLLLLIGIGILISFRFMREIPSQLFLISAVALWITGSINGVLGVNFRYQLPLVPVLLYLLVHSTAKVYQKRKFAPFDTSPN